MNKSFFIEKLQNKMLSQSELAKIMNINKSQVSRLFSGQRELKANEVMVLASALNVTSQQILDNIG